MKQINSIFISGMLFIGLFTAIVAANTLSSETAFTADTIHQQSLLDPDFYAQISFLLSEGEGCGCTPMRQVPIFAEGLTTDHNASGLTDEDGILLLELEFEQQYRIHIDFEGFQRVLFDFVVIDDQSFTFHMKQKNTPASTSFPRLSQLVQQIEHIRNTLTI